jgi:hypothetical protein
VRNTTPLRHTEAARGNEDEQPRQQPAVSVGGK